MSFIPEQFKFPLDMAAFLTSLSAVIGVMTNIVGFIGVVLSTAYAAYRLYDYIKHRK